jgi:hypothetical protein
VDAVALENAIEARFKAIEAKIEQLYNEHVTKANDPNAAQTAAAVAAQADAAAAKSAAAAKADAVQVFGHGYACVCPACKAQS